MAGSSAHASVVFNFTFVPGTSVDAQQAFTAAGAMWSSVLTDNVTVDLTVGTQALSPGLLGGTSIRRTSYSYSDFKTALAADATSADDATAVANLAPGADFDLLINRTSDNPNGSGSGTAYVDVAGANNSIINMTTANAKALGLAVGGGTVGLCTVTCDGSVVFNDSFAFDFDPTDGIAAGQFDFVGIAAHFFGQALGFVSGVDILDVNSPPAGGPFVANQFTFVSPLDMYRYSALSQSLGVIDWTADTRPKFFSIDGGATFGTGFSTGAIFGNGRLAGRWVEGGGLMDPTAATGEVLSLKSSDQQAMDVIGWNLKGDGGPIDPGTAVPEPATWAFLILGFAASGAMLRRRSAPVRSNS